MLRKLITLILAATICCAATSCRSTGSDDDDERDDKRTSVNKLTKKISRATDQIIDTPSEKNLSRGADLLFDAIDELGDQLDSENIKDPEKVIDMARAANRLFEVLGRYQSEMSRELDKSIEERFKSLYDTKYEAVRIIRDGYYDRIYEYNGSDARREDPDYATAETTVEAPAAEAAAEAAAPAPAPEAAAEEAAPAEEQK